MTVKKVIITNSKGYIRGMYLNIVDITSLLRPPDTANANIAAV